MAVGTRVAGYSAEFRLPLIESIIDGAALHGGEELVGIFDRRLVDHRRSALDRASRWLDAGASVNRRGIGRKQIWNRTRG